MIQPVFIKTLESIRDMEDVSKQFDWIMKQHSEKVYYKYTQTRPSRAT